MPQLDVTLIDGRAELERLGVDFEATGEHELRFKCPVHADENPSAFLNTEKNLWHCKTAGCSGRGDILSLICLLSGKRRATVHAELADRYDLDTSRTINLKTIEKHHEAIWECPLIDELYKRGLTDQSIRKARLGFAHDRITIPVFDLRGRVINVRRYLPGAPGPQKMRNTPGYGNPPALYQIEQTQKEHIWLCGGEMKALAVSQLIGKHSGAIAVTAGEGAWSPLFNKHLEDKIVYLCFDIDQGGRKAVDMVGIHLSSVVKELRVITLPLDPEEYPKGDVNDYIASGAKAKDLLRLQKEAPLWEPTLAGEQDFDVDPIDCELSQSVAPERIGQRLRVFGLITAADESPYIVPETVAIMCDRDQPVCPECSVYPCKPDDNGVTECTVHGENPTILGWVGSSKRDRDRLMCETFGVPAQCKSVSFAVRSNYTVQDIRLTPQLELTNAENQDIMLPALAVSGSLEPNQNYELIGRTYPHPKNQQAVLQISHAEPATDALSSFDPSGAELRELCVFQSTDIAGKLRDIYEDLAANVTRIYKRDDMHLFMDLAFHSVLTIPFEGRRIKGWSELLIVGDSAQGKTEASSGLLHHYSLGQRVDCKNATRAGLLGGLQEMAKRWFVTWGKIPQNDRRLVVLEEIKGMSTDLIGKLTDMRSSGIAEIPQIAQRKTYARTRLLMLSNPRQDKPLASYSFGIEAVRELIGSLEDIRRFDACLLVSAKQISPAEINKLSRQRLRVQHRYTTTLCNRLVLWAWTRTEDQIQIGSETVERILERSVQLCSLFVESIPIVDRGSMRYKLLRLSVALAARLFSTEDLETLVVRPEHVDFIADMLQRIYSDSVFGYAEFSEAVRLHNELVDPEEIQRYLMKMKHPKDLVIGLLHTQSIVLNDIMDLCDVDKDEAQSIVSFLVRKHALVREGRKYLKTPPFISLLRATRETMPERAVVVEGDDF
jgi:hypothetical protein